MNIYIIGFSIAAFFTISGCQGQIHAVNSAQTKKDSSININDTLTKTESTPKAEDFTLSIEPKVFNNLTMGKAKVVVTNNTNEKILTGLDFYVDFYEQNTWNRLNLHEGIIFDMVGVDIMPHSKRELEVDLKINPYTYKPGRYRITKPIITSNKKKREVTTEFTVE